MPVISGIRNFKQLKPAEFKRLVQAFAAELKGGKPSGSNPPYIFEIPREGSLAFGVTAVWNEFDGISSEDRTKIIMAAYKELGDKKRIPLKIDILGMTMKEALESGVFPYRIVPTVDYGEDTQSESRTSAFSAMFEAGAMHGPDGKPELRFPTRDIAEKVLDELTHKFKDAHWRLTEWE